MLKRTASQHNTQVCTMTGSNLFSLLTARGLLPLVPVLVHTVATLANLTAFTMIKQARPFQTLCMDMRGSGRGGGRPASRLPVAVAHHPTLSKQPKQTLPVYLAFLLFELTVGMFYPAYGSIKSQHIPEEVRSGVMNIFRIPLNGTDDGAMPVCLPARLPISCNAACLACLPVCLRWPAKCDPSIDRAAGPLHACIT